MNCPYTYGQKDYEKDLQSNIEEKVWHLMGRKRKEKKLAEKKKLH